MTRFKTIFYQKSLIYRLQTEPTRVEPPMKHLSKGGSSLSWKYKTSMEMADSDSS